MSRKWEESTDCVYVCVFSKNTFFLAWPQHTTPASSGKHFLKYRISSQRLICTSTSSLHLALLSSTRHMRTCRLHSWPGCSFPASGSESEFKHIVPCPLKVAWETTRCPCDHRRESTGKAAQDNNLFLWSGGTTNTTLPSPSSALQLALDNPFLCLLLHRQYHCVVSGAPMPLPPPKAMGWPTIWMHFLPPSTSIFNLLISYAKTRSFEKPMLSIFKTETLNKMFKYL